VIGKLLNLGDRQTFTEVIKLIRLCLTIPVSSAYPTCIRRLLTGTSNAGGVGRNRDSEPLCLLLMLQQTDVVNTVAGGPRPPSRKLWHIAGSKRLYWLREKTTKCLWQEASTLRKKNNRTAHLTARSDKFVAYVTNNKRLYSTFCTVEANYWQTRSIARPLCDSRAIARWNVAILRFTIWQPSAVLNFKIFHS